jgi:hypothetical protein
MITLTLPGSHADTAGTRGIYRMETDNAAPPLNPNSLTRADTAQLLTRVGGQPVRVETIQADLNAGAPANADGTINLVHYAAWLVREVERGD